MAYAAQQRRYAEKQQRFALKCLEKGSEASFGVRASDDRPWSPSDQYRELAKAPIFPSEWDEEFSDDVRSDDRMYFVGAVENIGGCRIMVDDETEYSIVKMKPFQPDGRVIFYEIQVRL